MYVERMRGTLVNSIVCALCAWQASRSVHLRFQKPKVVSPPAYLPWGESGEQARHLMRALERF